MSKWTTCLFPCVYTQIKWQYKGGWRVTKHRNWFIQFLRWISRQTKLPAYVCPYGSSFAFKKSHGPILIASLFESLNNFAIWMEQHVPNSLLLFSPISTIVCREDWLRNPTNIKVENNGAVGYVGSSLTMHNPLFSVHKLWLNKLMQCFYWSVTLKW